MHIASQTVHIFIHPRYVNELCTSQNILLTDILIKQIHGKVDLSSAQIPCLARKKVQNIMIEMTTSNQFQRICFLFA